MNNFQTLTIFCVLLVVLRVESVKDIFSNKKLNSFKDSLDYIITARKAPGEMLITLNTLECLITTPYDFKNACLEAYEARMRPLRLNYSTPNQEELLGTLAFEALEEVCKQTIKDLTSFPKFSNAAKELKSLLFRGDILCFISYADIPNITPNELEDEVKAMKRRNGFMCNDEAKLQILLNRYNLMPNKCPSHLASMKEVKCSLLVKILSTCCSSFGDRALD